MSCDPGYKIVIPPSSTDRNQNCIGNRFVHLVVSSTLCDDDDTPFAISDAFHHVDIKRLPQDHKQLFYQILGPSFLGIEEYGPEYCEISTKHLIEAYPNKSSPLEYKLIRCTDLQDVDPSKKVACGESEIEIISLDPESIFFQADRNAGKGTKKGFLDPTAMVLMRDVYRVGVNLCYVSLPYYWPKQYFHEIPKNVLDRVFYETAATESPRKLMFSDIFRIKTNSSRPLLAISGLHEPPSPQISTNVNGPFRAVLGGWHGHQFPLRVGMGCSFDVPVFTALCAAKKSIPELEICHGVITSIWPENNPDMIEVRLLLSRQNMPSHLKWKKLESNHLLQTNLIALVPTQTVFQIWRAVPFALFQHAFCRSAELTLDELDRPGSEFYHMDRTQISMMSQDCVIVAHLDITRKPGLGLSNPEAVPSSLVVPQSQPVSEIGSSGSALLQPEPSAANLAQLTSSVMGKDGLHLLHEMHESPEKIFVQLWRVAPLDADLALDVVFGRSQIFGAHHSPGLYSFAKHLQNLVERFAKSKQKLATDSSADNTIKLPFSGEVLMLLVRLFVPKHKRSVSVSDGMVQVEVPEMAAARFLTGTRDGNFDFRGTNSGFGCVELHSPVVFKWELYDRQRSTSLSRSIDGFASVTFAYYNVRDRFNDGIVITTKRHPQSQHKKS